MNTATQEAASRPGQALGDGVLVDPGWLAAHLTDPDVRVVEVDVSPAAYDDWHIDGAALWNVYADLNDADYRTVGAASVERLVARSGIGPDSTVVFYGYAPALGLWLMKLHGHSDARILDCSRDGCPPAHRRPLQRGWVVPLRRGVARDLLTGGPRRRP